MRFGAIVALNQGCSNQGWKYALLLTFSELKFESGFRSTHFNKQAYPATFVTFRAIFTPFKCNLSESVGMPIW